MKKITLLLILCILTDLTMKGQLLYSDDFSTYSVGNLEGQNGWVVSLKSADANGSSPLVVDEQISYSNYIHSGQGKVVRYVTEGVDGSNSRISAKSWGNAITSGSLYVGFMVRFVNATQSNTSGGRDFFGATFNNSGGTTLRGRIFLRKGTAANTIQLCITKNSTPSGTGTYWSGDLSINDTHFLVVKYTIVGTANSKESDDTYRLYIDPIIGSNEASATIFTDVFDATTVADGSGLNNFCLREKGDDMKISGIRVATTWEDVVKASPSSLIQLSAPTVGTPTNVTDNGFTAHWTPVDNATGYDVKVYLGANLINTINVSGQSTSSVEITGLMSGMTYTYQVVAKGDGTTYGDSDPSASSSEITTLDPYATDAIYTDFNDGSWGEIASSTPSSGSYPSYSIKGFDLTAATLCVGSISGIKGESHTNRIAIDKLANGGKIAFPTVNAFKQIEIHATAGTAGNGFQLKEFNPSTNSWSAIGSTYVYDANSKAAGVDSIYIISLERTSQTKLRIDNPTNGAIYIWQIITRNTNPALLAKPVVSYASNVTSSGATANWTPVENATGYKIYVYQGSTLIEGAPFSVSGQTINSFDITNLSASTAYSYKVQAIGDGDINYSDSFLSSAIEFTTLITGMDNLKNNPNITVVNKKIVCPETGDIRIFNMQGGLIESVRNVKTVQTDLPSGIYIVKFNNQNGETKFQKIAIQ